MSSTPLPLARSRPIVIAHRGASGYRPEHTRAAFELAIAQGCDAVEPDLVVSRDGVLVVRHENEISGTTDVAEHPEFVGRARTKTVDGVEATGWFTEDFTWEELSTLRARERLPAVRESNLAFDGLEPILRLEDVLGMLSAAGVALVAELKHATYFASLGFDIGALFLGVLETLPALDRSSVTVESFEATVLDTDSFRSSGVRLVYLVEASGSPADRPGTLYSDALTDDGLRALAEVFDGVSVDKKILLTSDASGHTRGAELVARAHAVGLEVFCWTLRIENRFLARANRLDDSPPEAEGHWQREFEMIMDAGVDGVFADHPDLALAVRSRRR